MTSWVNLTTRHESISFTRLLRTFLHRGLLMFYYPIEKTLKPESYLGRQSHASKPQRCVRVGGANGPRQASFPSQPYEKTRQQPLHARSFGVLCISQLPQSPGKKKPNSTKGVCISNIALYAQQGRIQVSHMTLPTHAPQEFLLPVHNKTRPVRLNYCSLCRLGLLWSLLAERSLISCWAVALS